MIQGLPIKNKYKVRIQCSTYNHSKYIEDALRGFSMQQTNFQFVCCVMDDASTDGESEVLKRWVDNHCNATDVEVYDHTLTIVLMAPDKDNSNCVYAIHLLKRNTWGKPERFELLSHWRQLCEYEAICEGDDYWIDPMKLQKQVDFLDNHEDYSMCFHNADILNEVGSIFSFEKLDNREYYSHEVFDKWIVPTASILYKIDALKSVVEDSRIINGDINLILGCTHSGKIYGMSETMSVYRVQANGITLKRIEDNNIDLQYSYISHYRCLYENYNHISYMLYSRKISDCYFFLSIAYYKKSQYIRCFKNILLSLLYNPCRLINRLLQKAISVK